MKTLTQRLLAFQSEIGTVAKDSDNPFYNSKYFDVNKVLEVIKPLLSKHGIVCMQPLSSTIIGDRVTPTLTTVFINADNAEDKMVSSIPLPEVPDAQKFGAAITYFRRYALVSALGLQGEEDDDANSLVKKPGTKTGKPQAKAATSRGSIF